MVSKRHVASKKVPFADVGEICEQMAIPIVSCESEQINERITFATYAEDEGIRIDDGAVRKN